GHRRQFAEPARAGWPRRRCRPRPARRRAAFARAPTSGRSRQTPGPRRHCTLICGRELSRSQAYNGRVHSPPGAAQRSIMGAWTPDDIPWEQFDPARVDPEIVRIVKAAALVEYNGSAYARHLCRVFANDPDFSANAERWGEEEVQHGVAL